MSARAKNNSGLGQRGETIVEVLLAMTVLAAIIGSCYSIANRSIIASQQSNDRMIATKIAESQLDKLKYIASNSTSAADFNLMKTASLSINLCIDNNNKAIIKNGATNCIKDDIYDYYFFGYDSNQKQFMFKITWPAYRSGTDEQQIFYYRVVAFND